MPIQRCSRLTVLLVIILVILIYIRNGEKQTRTSDFYTRTNEALDRAAEAPVGSESLHFAEQRPGSGVADRVDRAKKEAKQKANAKGADFFGDKSINDILEEDDAQRQRQRDDQEVLEANNVKIVPSNYEEDGVANVGNTGDPAAATKGLSDDNETKEQREVDIELNSILKKGPIIIFSKTYCPHSREAKRILLEKYKIIPAPYVVELDQHPLGPKLQNAIADSTGRRTVPNILINGKSIGGGDEMRGLDESAKLIDTVKSMGGKRIMEARLA